MKFKKPRGTQDLLGKYMKKWRSVEERVTRILQRYGYREIRTPIFEMSGLFVRTVGESSDIVTKEMYTFNDKKGRKLTLRPENTAPVMRAYLENGLQRQGGISRFYYMGPMFRYDRPQAGRYRQFHQIGAEAIGLSNPAIDAEIINLSLDIYKEFGFSSLQVNLNSVGCMKCRGEFMILLGEKLTEYKSELCDDCLQRAEINPFRVFDCKTCINVKKKLPIITDYLCGECSEHFEKLCAILEGMNVNYLLDPLLVRGLDYYTKTAYEIIHPELGAQNALCGGGRYDGLAGELGGASIPAVGFSAGMERLMQILPDELEEKEVDRPDLYFIVFDDECSIQAMILADKLRSADFEVYVDLSMRNIKKQLKSASVREYDYVVFIGQKEIEDKEVTLKNLKSGNQATVSFEKLVSYFSEKGVTGIE